MIVDLRRLLEDHEVLRRAAGGATLREDSARPYLTEGATPVAGFGWATVWSCQEGLFAVAVHNDRGRPVWVSARIDQMRLDRARTEYAAERRRRAA